MDHGDPDYQGDQGRTIVVGKVWWKFFGWKYLMNIFMGNFKGKKGGGGGMRHSCKLGQPV